jgi:hypothetical protein
MSTIVADFDLAATPASIVEANVTGLKFFQVNVIAVSHASSTIRCMQFSTDGGSTWFTTLGDYIDVPSNGTPANLAAMGFHFTSSVDARSGSMSVWQPGGGLLPQVYSQTNSDIYMFNHIAAAINRIRVFGGSTSSGTPNAGNMTGGRVQVWGK